MAARAMSEAEAPRGELAGFVLAGGASLRMGRAKALLEIAGETQIARVARLVGRAAANCSIVGEVAGWPSCGFSVIADRWPGTGPLGGMATALGASGAEWNLMVACDMPYLTQEWLAHLAGRALGSRADAVIPMTERGAEPLCAAYNRSAEPLLRGALERGVRKVREALEELRVERLEPAEWKGFDSGGRLFKNMNAPADYEEARAWFAAHRKP